MPSPRTIAAFWSSTSKGIDIGAARPHHEGMDEATRNRKAHRWLMRHDGEGRAYWREMPPTTNFIAEVMQNLLNFGGRRPGWL